MRLGQKEFTRREFFKLAVPALAYAAYESVAFKVSVENAKDIGIFHHVIHMPNIDKKWDKTYLLHFSDSHISSRGVDFIDPGVIDTYTTELQSYLNIIGASEGKTIIIDTGDLVSDRTGTGEPTPLADLDEALGYIARIPALVKFSVEGNHEIRHPENAQISTILDSHEYVRLGLTDQSQYVFDPDSLPFSIVGLPDFTMRERFWYQSATAESFLSEVSARDTNKPIIVAAHTSMIDSWKNGVLQDVVKNGLFLHGHTHGGQIGANSPAQYLAGRVAVFNRVKQKSKYYRGVNEVAGDNLVGVSPGLGHAGFHRVRTAKPGVVIYEIRVA